MRYIYYTGKSSGFICRPVREVMRHMLRGGNVGLLTTRSVEIGRGFEHTFCTSGLAQLHAVSLKEVNYLFPLWLEDIGAAKDLLPDDNVPLNLSQQFLACFASALGLSRVEPYGLPLGTEPNQIFGYIYALLHSPSYRSRYSEILRVDFPRLPLTGDMELFRALAQLGGELTALHLLESPRLDQPITEFIGNRNPEVEKISWSHDTVWVDKAQTTGFRGVRDSVWNFHIGGYQICEKWLKDRKGSALSKDDIAHYHKVVVALSETIRLMAEIDKVIEAHGGWPGAFQPRTSSDSSSPGGAGAVAIGKSGAAATSAPTQLPREAEDPLTEIKPEASAVTDPHSEESMALIREILAGGPLSRDALIRTLAERYGYRRLGKNIEAVLDNHVRTAVRRGIAEVSSGTIQLFSASIEQYERAFLKDQFLAALSTLSQGFVVRDDALRAFSRWLGFRRLGSVIQDTSLSLINGLLREGRLEASGLNIRRVRG